MTGAGERPRRVAGAARALFAGGLALAGASGTAFAHAFGERYELPAPVWLFIVGGALTVTLTFVMVALFAHAAADRYAEACVDLTPTRLGRALCHRWTRAALQGAGVFALATVVLAGLFGDIDPNRNIAPTLVWVVWWVGFSYFVMLVGNLWPVIDPWRAIFDAGAAWRRRRFGSRRAAPPKLYPARLGAWPALVLLFLFGWFELIFPFSAAPRVLAWLVIAYSAVTWAGMARYGPDAWRRNVDPFHRVFGLFARFAPFAPTDGNEETGHRARVAQGAETARGLVLRPYAAGLLGRRHGAVSTATACFMIAMLAIVLFDGLLGSGHWTAIENAIHAINPKLGDVGWIAAHTAALLFLWLVLLGLFLLACALMGAMTGAGLTTLDYARAFALTLVPIAVGYHFAHTFSYLVTQGQSIIPLISDPLGMGWDLFGTRRYQVDIAVMSTKTAWYLAVGAIVAGHAVSVYLAHVAADRLLASRARAFQCLVPMTVLMVVYTIVSLQILAEPLVRYSGPQETII